jgi:hypothetical protein
MVLLRPTHICAGTRPHLRRDPPTSAPGLAPHLHRNLPASAPACVGESEAPAGPQSMHVQARARSCSRPQITHTHIHTAHTRSRARAHTHTHTHTHSLARALTHSPTLNHTHTLSHTTNTHSLSHTQQTHTHTHTHTHTRTHARTPTITGSRGFPRALPTAPATSSLRRYRCHTCVRTGLTPATCSPGQGTALPTYVQGLGSPRPHLPPDWARPSPPTNKPESPHSTAGGCAAVTHGMQPIWLQQHGASRCRRPRCLAAIDPAQCRAESAHALLPSPKMDGCTAISSDRCVDRKIDTRFGS